MSLNINKKRIDLFSIDNYLIQAFCYLPAYLLFLLMLLVLNTHQLVKGILLIWVLFSILVALLSRDALFLHLHPQIAYWTLFYCVLGSVWMFWGAINSTPGAWRVGTVYIMWPLCFTFMLSAIRNDIIIKQLIRILVIAGFVGSCYGLLMVLNLIDYLPNIAAINQDIDSVSYRYYEDEGYGRLQFKFISTLFFLIPFIFTALCTWSKNDTVIPRWFLWLTFILSFSLAIISGRRTLLLLLILTPFIVIAVILFIKNKKKANYIKLFLKNIIIIFLLFSFLMIYFIKTYDLNFVGGTVKNISIIWEDNPDSPSVIERQIQAKILVEEWSKSPILGAGHGAAASYIRSDKMSWAYELFYLALLFQVGLLGFIGYLSGVLWIYLKAFSIIKINDKESFYLFPVMVGMTIFLLGSASNPYLINFDAMWVIFLPLAIINNYLLANSGYAMKISSVN